MTKKNKDNNTVEKSKQKKDKFDLSIEKWFPSMISIIGGTAILVWAFFSLINPLENDILELKTKGYSEGGRNTVAVTTIFLEETNGTDLSKTQGLAIKNIEYKMKERNDLVLIIAGYTNDNLNKDQFAKAQESELAAKQIKELFKSYGISTERVFYKGYGHDVPKYFPKEKENNVALILIDIYTLMEGAAYGNIMRFV